MYWVETGSSEKYAGDTKLRAMQQAALASVIVAVLLLVTLGRKPSMLLNKSDVLKDIKSEIVRIEPH